MNKQKMWCLAGSILLTPIVTGIVLLIIVGSGMIFGWLLEHFEIIGSIIGIMFVLALSLIIWSALYTHCMEYKRDKQLREEAGK